jgi:hypothetical protein
MRWGLAFSNAVTSGIDTYMKMSQFMHQQDEWSREQAVRDAMKDDSGNQPQQVTPGSLATQMQGSDGKADGDAVMGTYGAMQSAGSDADAQSVYKQGMQQAQDANSASAAPQTFNVTNPNYTGPAATNATPQAPAQPTPQPQAGIPSGPVPLPGGPAPAGSLDPNEDTMPKPPANAGSMAGGLGPGEQVVNVPPLPGGTPMSVAQAKAGTGPDTTQIPGSSTSTGPYGKPPIYGANGQPQPDPLEAKINTLGVKETPPDVATPVDPQSKIIPIKASPISSGGLAGGDYTISHNDKGEMVMTKAQSAADKLDKLAAAYYKNGFVDKVGPTMQAAMQIRSQEMTQNISKIMMDNNSTADQKVGALAHLAGAQAFKTENGNYIVPGLGPQDANGNPMPMSIGQVGSLASMLATPEGLHKMFDLSIEQQKLGIQKQTADAQTSQAQTAQSKLGIESFDAQSRRITANNSTTTANATAARDQAWADNSKASTDALVADKNAKADSTSEQAAMRRLQQDIYDKLGQAGEQLRAGTINPQQYKQIRDTSMDQLRALSMRGPGGNATGEQKPEKPVDVQDGSAVRTGEGRIMINSVDAGQLVSKDQFDQIQSLKQEINGKDQYLGLGVASQAGQIGVKISPVLAAKLGVNPQDAQRLYPSAAAAAKALLPYKIHAQTPGSPIQGLPMTTTQGGTPGLMSPGL